MSLFPFLSRQNALYWEVWHSCICLEVSLPPQTITSLAVLTHISCDLLYFVKLLSSSRHSFKFSYSYQICIRHYLLALWLPLYTTCYRFKIWEIHLYFSAWKKVHMCSRRCEVNATLPVSWFWTVRDWLFHPYKRKLCGSLCRLSAAGGDL